MKFSEAMKALEEGKKVRLPIWPKEDYLDNSLMGGNIEHMSIPWPYCLRYDWELYEEPIKMYSFMEAVHLMKEGKKVKRLHGSFGDFSIKRAPCDFIFYCKESISFPLRISDVEATDWIIVEDKC